MVDDFHTAPANDTPVTPFRRDGAVFVYGRARRRPLPGGLLDSWRPNGRGHPMTPTQRSLRHLRDSGYLAEVVERWVPGANIRKDLFGWIDIIAIRKGEVLAVQCTSTGVSERIKKISDSDTIGPVRQSGMRVEVHGWRKGANGRYALRVEDLS